MENKKVCRDIIINSYYMISLFEKAQKTITNLKLQKLMYFVEALYMYQKNEPSLFDEEWVAWNYGPVSKTLYKKYRDYGSMPIELSEEEESLGDNISDINKDYIVKIYNTFGQLEAFKLVTLTHLDGSPWHKIKKEDKYNLDSINNSSVISKEETKEWFKIEFGELFRNDGRKQ